MNRLPCRKLHPGLNRSVRYSAWPAVVRPLPKHPTLGGTAMYRPCGSGFLRWTLWSSRRAKQVAGSTVMETLTVCLSLAGSEPVTCGVYRGRGGDR